MRSLLKQQGILIAIALSGAVAAGLLGWHFLYRHWWFAPVAAGMVFMGLYLAAYDIDFKVARRDWKLLGMALTFGVVLKAAFTGVVMGVAFGNPFFIHLGMITAQIDPLSVSALQGSSRMSLRAKTVLKVWASFDDPGTVVLLPLVPMVILWTTGQDIFSSGGFFGGNLSEFARNLVICLVFVALIFGAWYLGRHHNRGHRTRVITGHAGTVTIGGSTIATAVRPGLMSSAALLGSLVRPPFFERWGGFIARRVLEGAMLLTGMLLSDGVNWSAGVMLGLTTFLSQMVVGFLLTSLVRLPMGDRVYLALAQQNGMTAVILSLLTEAMHPGTIAIVAPAILVANALHASANYLADRRLLAA